MKTLWQWSRTKDDWLWCCAVADAACKVTLRGYRRRNPRGTVFKWTDGSAPVRTKGYVTSGTRFKFEGDRLWDCETSRYYVTERSYVVKLNEALERAANLLKRPLRGV